MTKLMEQVIAKVSALPPEEQEHYAILFLSELEDEQKWDEAFAASLDQLARLADEALQEFKGRQHPAPGFLRPEEMISHFENGNGDLSGGNDTSSLPVIFFLSWLTL